MKPETILQKDFLDILFDGRDKDYGAYNLRKSYNSRLIKSLSFTTAFVFLVSLAWYVKANSSMDNRGFVPAQPVTDVYLKALDEPQKPRAIKKPKAFHKKLTAEIQHTKIKIVPDKEVVKPIAENKELENKGISTLTKGGVEAVEDEILPAVAEGIDNGKIIEREKVQEEKVAPLTRADVMPEFPGGSEAFTKFMLRNLREPDDLEEGEKIVVVVKFIVEADGSIVNAEVLKSGGRFDEEVLRVVKKMPRWKPGVEDGKLVAVYFTLPVTFAASN